jgi:hypothetical protein
MATATKTRDGLCTTCRFTTDCTFPQFHDKTVRDCLEFDGTEPANGRSRPAGAVLSAPGAALAGTQDQALEKAPRGLCRTCDRLDTCTFAKPISGVWFCEEYV